MIKWNYNKTTNEPYGYDLYEHVILTEMLELRVCLCCRKEIMLCERVLVLVKNDVGDKSILRIR